MEEFIFSYQPLKNVPWPQKILFFRRKHDIVGKLFGKNYCICVKINANMTDNHIYCMSMVKYILNDLENPLSVVGKDSICLNNVIIIM